MFHRPTLSLVVSINFSARNCFSDIRLLFSCTLFLSVFMLRSVSISALCLQNISLIVYVVSLSEILYPPSQQFTKRQK